MTAVLHGSQIRTGVDLGPASARHAGELGVGSVRNPEVSGVTRREMQVGGRAGPVDGLIRVVRDRDVIRLGECTLVDGERDADTHNDNGRTQYGNDESAVRRHLRRFRFLFEWGHVAILEGVTVSPQSPFCPARHER